MVFTIATVASSSVASFSAAMFSAFATATASSSATFTTSSVDLSHTVAVEFQQLFVLDLALAQFLATSSRHEVLLFCFTRESLAFWELLASAFIGLASLETTAKLELLLGLFSKVVVEALHLGLLGFRRRAGFAVGWNGLSFSVFFVSLGNGFTGLLIIPFSAAGFRAPSMTSLLLVLTKLVNTENCVREVITYAMPVLL
jgi:hypothetical protein